MINSRKQRCLSLSFQKPSI